MATKMELSLEDIIKTTPGLKGGRGRGRRRGRGGARGAGGGGRGRLSGGFTRRNQLSPRRFSQRRGGIAGQGNRADGVWVHDKFIDGGGRRTALSAQSNKITVGNLDYGVSDADIIELFGEIGPIRYASVHYDRSGRSMGKADVVFERRSDAQMAISQYNGVPLDGRAMMISFATAGGAAPAAMSTSPRPLRQLQGGRVGSRGGGVRGRGGRGGRGAGRGGASGGRGGGRGGAKAKMPTAAELDAELDAYISANPK